MLRIHFLFLPYNWESHFSPSLFLPPVDSFIRNLVPRVFIRSKEELTLETSAASKFAMVVIQDGAIILVFLNFASTSLKCPNLVKSALMD